MDQALLALMKQLSAEEKLMFQSDYEDQKKSTVLAVVLALLLGGFGAHWFYLGRTGRALTYLLLHILGGVLTVLLIGYVVLAAVWIACLIDAVFMGGTSSAIAAPPLAPSALPALNPNQPTHSIAVPMKVIVRLCGGIGVFG